MKRTHSTTTTTAATAFRDRNYLVKDVINEHLEQNEQGRVGRSFVSRSTSISYPLCFRDRYFLLHFILIIQSPAPALAPRVQWPVTTRCQVHLSLHLYIFGLHITPLALYLTNLAYESESQKRREQPDQLALKMDGCAVNSSKRVFLSRLKFNQIFHSIPPRSLLVSNVRARR